ncbi:cation:proton antiporter [Sulfuritalea sp.]|uniref:cation:proton antiporter n=1 Tax=Sulfuritalea sp. TaxID=2480090 RepID=UPI00286DE72D|nr:cation:proton antiporter [Sulfuritalea sp.]
MAASLNLILVEIAWPAALALAWVAGEFGRRWLGLPRISSYAIAGFLMASSQGGFLSQPSGEAMVLLTNVALALILFELGYRINLGWLRANPWLGATSVVEATGTFAVVFFIARIFDQAPIPSLLLAALAVPTSPAAVLRVVNELRGSGQVTERTLHLSAFNCVFAVVAFKAVVGYAMLTGNGGVFTAVWNSVVVVLVSAGLGTLFGVAVPGLLRVTGGLTHHTTVAFALAVLLLTALTDAFKFSPILAALAFGLVARHRRVLLSQAQRNFGALGDLLTVLLFVFIASTLDWRHVVAGIELGVAVLMARLLVKTCATTLFARISGLSWRKGVLTGVALMPLSVFSMMLLEQTRHLDAKLVEHLPGVAAMMLLLNVLGPLATQWALCRAGEAQPGREG